MPFFKSRNMSPVIWCFCSVSTFSARINCNFSLKLFLSKDELLSQFLRSFFTKRQCCCFSLKKSVLNFLLVVSRVIPNNKIQQTTPIIMASEPGHSKTYKMACVPTEDSSAQSDQSLHSVRFGKPRYKASTRFR